MRRLLLLSFLFSVFTHGAVLGIDFGSDFVKVAVVAPGHAFEICLDPSSKRKSPAVVGFDDGERRFGHDASRLLTKRPKETFQYISRLLGKTLDTPILSDLEAQYYPYKFFADEARNSIRIRFGDSEDRSFTVEEIVAMYLKQAQSSAMAYLDSSSFIRDCVITVPDFWTTKERNALLDAAELAGLNVLSLVNENSAAALHYGIEMSSDVNKTENFIFYNMGSTSTKVSVVQYDAYLKSITKRKNKTVGQVNVLGQSWDETLGGNAFDSVLLSQLKVVAEEQMGTELTDNFRVMARLREATKKAKKKLSVNKDTTVRVTSLYDDKDFRADVTRADFEANCADLFERILPPIDIALARSGLARDDIEGIVLMGGGTRIPKIQKILDTYLEDKELRRNLNTDEAAALGAAFKAANHSTTFRVRQIGFVDRAVLPVAATINNFEDFEAEIDLEKAEFRKTADIFASGSQLKKRKSVHFKHDKEVYVSIAYATEEGLPAGTLPHIDHYNISGIEAAVAKYAEKNVTDQRPKISLSFEMDTSGIAKLSKATATFQENVEVKIPIIKNETATIEAEEEVVVEDKSDGNDTSVEAEATEADEKSAEAEDSDLEKAAADDDAEDVESAGEKAAEEGGETPAEAEDTDAANADDTEEQLGEAEEEETTTTAEPVIEYETIWKTQKRKVTLKIRALGSYVRTMSKADQKNSTKVLMELDEADQAIRDTAASLNDLESFILERRPLLYEDEDEFVMKVTTEAQREDLISMLTEAEDWLYDVEDADAGVFKSKLRDIQKEVLPVFMRAYELTQRDYYVAETDKHIGVLRKMITNLSETMTWINATEFEKLTASCDEFEGWFTSKVEEQSEKELTDEPAFKVEDVKTRVEKLSEEVRRIAVRPKPVEKKKNKKKKKPRKDGNETSTEEAGTEGGDADDDDEGQGGDDADASAEETILETEEAEDPVSTPEEESPADLEHTEL